MSTNDIEALRPRKAVLYLRVSSKKQTETASDIDKDGNSIATQRDICEQKAGSLGAEIVHEFVEPGVSAQTIEKRPEFQAMMTFLADNRDVDYVIVYARSRAFRNFVDAAITRRHLDKLDVRLLSAREDFGEGTYAEAMEAVTDIMNQVQNQLSGEDIRIKMRNKAISGGTIGRAKLGYLNVRKDIDGRQLNTIELDPKRAPLILKAWELYATGDYTLERLEAAMADMGLTSRTTARSMENPITLSKLHQMLKDPYYCGYVTYKGDIYPGRHEPIIGQELFEQVQSVMDRRSRRGQRDRVHSHFAKGLLFCKRCDARGVTSRMIYTEAIGRGGTYQYFFCRERKEGSCDLPYIPVHRVEEAIEIHFETLELRAGFLTDIHARINQALNDEEGSVKDIVAKVSRQLKELDVKEERLIELAADGLLPQQKIRMKLHEIHTQKRKAQDTMASASAELTVGGELFKKALAIADDPARLYSSSSDATRRLINQSFFEKIHVDEIGDVTTDLAEPFAGIYVAHTVWAATGRHQGAETPADDTKRRPRIAEAPDLISLSRVYSVNGSNKTLMVEHRGIEPLTSSLRTKRSTN